METTFKFRIDFDLLDAVKSYASGQDMSTADVFRDGAKALMSGNVPTNVPTENKNVPTNVPTENKNVPTNVRPEVQMLKDMLSGHVNTAANIDRLPFGEPKERISPAAASPEHGDLVNRFRDILRSASPEGIRVIKAKLSEWEDGQ